MFSSNGGFEGGYSYSPYGEARFTSTTDAVTANVMRYIGSPLDSSGIYKLGARYYDPSTGRFTQMDPSGQESHPYAYASCNPINGKDPSVTDASCVLGVLFGVGVAYLAVLEIADIGASLAAIPLTGGASAVAGAALATGLSVELAAGIGLAAYELRLCLE